MSQTFNKDATERVDRNDLTVRRLSIHLMLSHVKIVQYSRIQDYYFESLQRQF